jgi:hypothetical protein
MEGLKSMIGFDWIYLIENHMHSKKLPSTSTFSLHSETGIFAQQSSSQTRQ